MDEVLLTLIFIEAINGQSNYIYIYIFIIFFLCVPHCNHSDYDFSLSTMNNSQYKEKHAK